MKSIYHIKFIGGDVLYATEQKKEWYLVPVSPRGRDYSFAGLLHLSGRLRASRGGGYEWKAEGKGRDLLSSAEYCPLIKGTVRGMIEIRYATPAVDLKSILPYGWKDYVYQRDLAGNTQTLLTINEVIAAPFAVGRRLVEWVTTLTHPLFYQQGHLDVGEGCNLKRVLHSPAVEGLPERMAFRFFNHTIVSRGLPFRVGVLASETALRAVILAIGQSRVEVTSPDHVDEPLAFQLEEGDTLVLVHPFPAD